MDKKEYFLIQKEKEIFDRLSNFDRVCIGCGEYNSLIMKHAQSDHLEGKMNSEIKGWMCPNCHFFKTELQNLLPKAQRTKTSNPRIKLIYAIRSLIFTMQLQIKSITKYLNLIGVEDKKW